MHLLLYILSCFLVYTVSGSYHISDRLYSQLQMRSRPGTFSINETLYLLGGDSPGLDNKLPILKMFTALSFNNVDGSVQHNDLTKDDTPAVVDTTPVLLGNDRVLMLGGTCEIELNTACYSNTTLFIAEYHFNNQTWSTPRIPNMNVTRDLPSGSVSAVLASNGLVYLRYNAAIGVTSVIPEFYSYNPDTFEMVNLTQTMPLDRAFDNAAYCVIQIPNGELAFIAENMTRSRFSVDTLLLYNPVSQLWRVDRLYGDEEIPLNKQYYQIVPDPKGEKIYLFGGRARSLPHGSFSELSMLDTTTWTWKTVKAIGTPPGGRHKSAMTFINNDLLVITNGVGDYFWFNDINLIRLADTIVPQWVTNLSHPIYVLSESDGHYVNRGAIIGGVIGGIIGLLVLLFIVLFRRRIRTVLGKLIRFWLWSPRMGEPLWTEAARCIIKIVLTIIALAIVVANISNILNSPVVTISYIDDLPRVSVPDMRICVDGAAEMFVGCQTDTISPQQCNTLGYLRELDIGVHRPFFTQGTGHTSCRLLTLPESFHLSSPESGDLVDNNGTFINLRIGYIPSVAGKAAYVYISLYPQGRDPNLVTYFDQAQSLTEDQMALWINEEQSDIHLINHYSIGSGTFSTVRFQHETRESLTQDYWNRVGFFSKYNTSLDLNTDIISSPMELDVIGSSGSPVMQTVNLVPTDFKAVRTRQQKLHTVVSVLGPVGGALTIFGALLVLLFGTRTSSPWGFVQQFSFGPAKRSLMYNLYTSFYPWRTQSVPFVEYTKPLESQQQSTSPHQAVDIPACPNSHDDQWCRHAKELEEMHSRFQMMEVVLKHYYINTEVFDRISTAMKQDFENDQSSVNTDDQSVFATPLPYNQSGSATERSRFASLLSLIGARKSNDVTPPDSHSTLLEKSTNTT